jgi:general stress protein 26
MTQAQSSEQNSSATVEQLVGLLRGFEAATLVTRARGGSLHGRPMSIAAVDDDGTLWFITSVTSAKADEVAEDSRATVTMQGGSRFLCLNGNVELVFDPERIKALWQDSYRVWCEGAGDADVVLLKLTACDGEYWDEMGAGLKYALRPLRGDADADKLEERGRSRDAPDGHDKLWRSGEPMDAAEPLVSRR